MLKLPQKKILKKKKLLKKKKKLPTNMVLCNKAFYIKFLHLCMKLPHLLPVISKTQEWFSLHSFQDMSSNVNLLAEPFLYFFS